MSAPPDTRNSFVTEVRRRRNLFWYWLPFGLLVMGLSHVLIEHFVATPKWLDTAFNLGWIIVAVILIMRIKNIRCPRCGNLALRPNPLISIKHIRCRWCAYPYEYGEE